MSNMVDGPGELPNQLRETSTESATQLLLGEIATLQARTSEIDEAVKEEKRRSRLRIQALNSDRRDIWGIIWEKKKELYGPSGMSPDDWDAEYLGQDTA